MIVAIDIGNTNITIAFIKNNEITHSYRLTTKLQRTSDEFGQLFKSFLNETPYSINEIEDVVISSVVPKIMHSFNNAVRKYLKKEPLHITPSMDSGIPIAIPDPSCVGADRIVDAAGAYYTYGGPCLVLDFGTASTFDYINEKGEFMYGITAPGLEITSQALSNMAAQLPDIEIKKPQSILATDTISSMQSGVVYGYIGLTEKIISQIKKEIGTPMKVIATGGLGRMISEEVQEINIYDKDLTFKGLLYIYHRMKHA